MTSKTKNPYCNFTTLRSPSDFPACMGYFEPIVDRVTSEEVCEGLGAKRGGTVKVTVIVPTKDQHGKVVPNTDQWRDSAVNLCTEWGGGATEVAGRGAWTNPATQQVVREDVMQVSSMLTENSLRGILPALREFCHRMGRETNQGSVAVIVRNDMLYIDEFDVFTNSNKWIRIREKTLQS